MNPQNFGVVTGRLTRDPKVFPNKDGSRKVMITVAAPNNYKNSDGKRDSQFVQLEGLVSKDRVKTDNGEEKLGVYDYMKSGSLVTVQYSLRTNPYTDKDGNKQYPQVSFIETVSLLESKSVTENRQKKNADDAEEAPAPAEAPETAAEDTPFND